MRRVFAALSVVCVGCTPLVATVGVEGEERINDAGPAIEAFDAGSPGALDAAAAVGDGAVEQDALTTALDGAEADATLARNCIVLPDLVDVWARTDGGISALDSGVIWVATDVQQGCPLPEAGYYTYGRVDGQPILPAGATHSVRWPASIGTGPAMMLSTNLPCGGEPFVFPLVIPWVLPLLEDCREPPAGKYLRVGINPPSPFPLGLRLCEGSCQ